MVSQFYLKLELFRDYCQLPDIHLQVFELQHLELNQQLILIPHKMLSDLLTSYEKSTWPGVSIKLKL